ncbi:MAG: phytanoyl-CoA dioxygenase family protein [Pyrinomonadaceae bacterium]
MRNIRALFAPFKRTELVWRYGLNFSPTLDYKLGRGGGLNAVEKGIVNTLDRDGIAFSSINELLADGSQFDELETATKNLLDAKTGEFENLRSRVNDESEIGNKTFNWEVLGSELSFDSGCAFARFGLNDTLLNVANAYFGMIAKLRYYNVWKTFASNGAARESQLWHFDREDNYILKMFLYLDDVDEGAGPISYAPGTHRKGSSRAIKPEYFIEGGVRRTTDEQMNAVFPKDRWVTGVGKKGTIVFADTRGFHKGGEARTKDRLMYTCMFTSPASQSKRLITFPPNLETDSLTDKQIRALQI